jgi:hypothetical protein
MLDPNYSDLLSAFRGREVRFLVVGAYALGVHGWSRATMDFDVWVEASAENASRVVAALADFGAPLHGVTVEELSKPGVGLHIGVPPIRIDVLTEISGVAFADAWARRVTVQFGEESCAVIGPEELLVNKRAAGRPKDLADAAALERILKKKQG